MVYQIYYDNGEYLKVLFDIEVYMKIDDTLYDKVQKKYISDEKWYVEMHSCSFISESVDYIKSKISIFTDDDWKEFKKDCNELEELRGWLWETHNNKPRIEEEANKDYSTWRTYVKDKVYAFANKYGLHVNED